MKRKFIFIIFLILFFTGGVLACNCSRNKFTGRWTEKISERVVMDVFQDKLGSEYKVFITWREDNLAQKEIYRFKAKPEANGCLNYQDGELVYRTFDKNEFEDKVAYTDGSGKICINGDKLTWTDNKDNTSTEFIKANKDLQKSTTVKNKMFTFTLPEELKGVYKAEIKKDKISIYHKKSQKAGFGGFAFGIKAYKNPADHAVMPGSKKLGELTDKKGNLYDIVVKYPTDVQYDYTKSPKAPKDYEILYNIGEFVNINGLNGYQYHKNQGMLGEDLYKDILKKHITAINEKWNYVKLENEDMSYMYKVLAQGKKNVFDRVGYIYFDVNADGIDELLIGEIADGEWKGIIYDIYTMVDRKPQHVISGGNRDRYFVCDYAFICNEYSSGAKESGVRVYNLVENSTELFPQVSFKYDGYQNEKRPWFLSYGNNIDADSWENVSEETYKERKLIFERYERFDFIPLSKLAK